jgi:hypothetical protein
MSTVFVVHSGSQEYVRCCVAHSQFYGNNTLLIGSEKQFAVSPTSFYSDEIKLPIYEDFKKIYVHLSPNPENFELLCFKRYFALKEIANILNLKRFWLIDSDILLFENLSPLETFLINNSYDCAIWTPAQSEYMWTSSPHLSFWTIDALENFVDFIMKTYRYNFIKLQEKWQYHLKEKLQGGVCDMTLLYLWNIEGNQNIYNIDNLYKDLGVIHDSNISFSDNINLDNFFEKNYFAMKKLANIKEVIFKKGRYYIISKDRGRLFPVASMHFQGAAKVFMPYIGNHRGTTLRSMFIPITIKLMTYIRLKFAIRTRLRCLLDSLNLRKLPNSPN